MAYRTALQARSDAARRRDVEKIAGAHRQIAATPADDDLAAALHEEIERLPDRFRLPVVLCYLEGMTRDQAADQLRCTEGSVRGRLAKGRELLRHRLTRRGITLAIPPRFPVPFRKAWSRRPSAPPAGGGSAAVAALVTAASRGWVLAWFKAAAVALLALGTAAAAFAYLNPAVARPSRRQRPRASQSSR